ncbi:DUF243 domain containing protein, partial [Asbolus verrucosus]
VALIHCRPQYNYPVPQLQISTGRYATLGAGGLGGGLRDNSDTSVLRTSFGNEVRNEIDSRPAISGGTLIRKHIYLHVAPPEPEEFKQQSHISERQATKHYKIIFIKVPSSPVQTVPSVSLQSQTEEKTLVYVLVKKPDEPSAISLPTVTSTQPTKPEVYFIRYKTRKSTSNGGEKTEIRGTGAGRGIGIGGSTSSGSSSTFIGGGIPSLNYGPPR